MYFAIIAGCLIAAIVLYRKDARNIASGALIIVAVQAALFAADDLLMTTTMPVLAEINRVVWLLIYTVGPLFSAVVLFVYAATVLPAERFDSSHKAALAGGIVAVGLAVYHVAFYGLALPDNMFDLYLDIFAALFSYIAFMYAAYALSTHLYFFSMRRRKAFDFILVLGYRLDGDRMSPILTARLDKAYELWVEAGKSTPIILSGGQCFAGTLSESQAMKNYLLECGVPEHQLLIEGQSSSTLQNMLHSKTIMETSKPGASCLIVTSEFHVLRALMLARALGINAQGVGAKTVRDPLLLGLTTREMMAFMFRRKESVLLFAEAMLFLEAWRYVQIPMGVFS